MNLKKLKSSELKSAIYGMLLGDAGLSLAGKRSITYRMHYAHSLKQKDYALWKKNILDQIGSVNTKVYEYTHPVKNHSSIRVTTNARKYFNKVSKFFYLDNKKFLSEKVLKKINPLALAIWYMDDGSIQKRGTSRRCYLHTQNFNYEENVIIKNWFIKTYNICPKVQAERKKNGKVYYLLVFNSSECDRLLNIVRPYVNQVDCMKYKL